MPANEHAVHPVVVGVSPGQPPHIVVLAAQFALRFGAPLICAYVDPSRYVTSEAADGSISSSSIDPDADVLDETFDEKLAASLTELLRESGVEWRTLLLAGEVAAALGHLAQTVDASMLVVGTHVSSVSGGIHELFNRSVAVQLAHHQHRPVVVVPARSPGTSSQTTSQR